MNIKKVLLTTAMVSTLTAFSVPTTFAHPVVAQAAKSSSKKLVTNVALEYDKTIHVTMAALFMNGAYSYTIKLPNNNAGLTGLTPKYPNSFKGLSGASAGLVNYLNKSLNKYVRGDKSTHPKEDFGGRSQAVLRLSSAVADIQRKAVSQLKNKMSKQDYNKLQSIYSTMMKNVKNKQLRKQGFDVYEHPNKKAYAIINHHWELGKAYFSELSKVFSKMK